MDLVNQNKFKNGLIIVLLVINLLTVSVIWIQTTKRDDTPVVAPPGKGNSESVNLMKQVLELNEDQTRELDMMMAIKIDESKKYNDSLDYLKKQLAEDLIKDHPDSIDAQKKSQKIGQLQTKVEMIRYNHFKELLSICTPGQKQKLKPVLIELFGKKPPKGEEQKRDGNKKPNVEKQNNEMNPVKEDERRDYEKPKPPSIEKRLDKYTERLNLDAQQVEKVKTIMVSIKKKEEMLRNLQNPNPDQIEMEKKKNREEEDQNIMKLLNDDQKKEFSKMINKRNR